MNENTYHSKHKSGLRTNTVELYYCSGINFSEELTNFMKPYNDTIAEIYLINLKFTTLVPPSYNAPPDITINPTIGNYLLDIRYLGSYLAAFNFISSSAALICTPSETNNNIIIHHHTNII